MAEDKKRLRANDHPDAAPSAEQLRAKLRRRQCRGKGHMGSEGENTDLLTRGRGDFRAVILNG